MEVLGYSLDDFKYEHVWPLGPGRNELVLFKEEQELFLSASLYCEGIRGVLVAAGMARYNNSRSVIGELVKDHFDYMAQELLDVWRCQMCGGYTNLTFCVRCGPHKRAAWFTYKKSVKRLWSNKNPPTWTQARRSFERRLKAMQNLLDFMDRKHEEAERRASEESDIGCGATQV